MKLTVAQAVAKRLQDLMEEKGATVEALAEFTHLSAGKVEKILCAGYAEVAINNIFTLCRAMDITLQEFYGDKLFDAENLALED